MRGFVVCVSVCAGCSSPTCATTNVARRDFDAFPAIQDQASYSRIVAVSDIHGGYDRLVALLLADGVVATRPSSPHDAEWTGGDATLVVTGDLIDKGSQSVEVIDFMRALENSAATQGGHVIVTLGNHEAEFLADPYNTKADVFDMELTADQLDPCVVATSDPRGAWLRSRPLAVRIGDWFFSHAGATAGLGIADLEQALRDGLNMHDFAAPEITGADSILEARDWWDASPDVAKRNADALAVSHFVFGHTPDALGPAGAIAVGREGLLFRIDVGMSPAVDDSEGALLEIHHDGSGEVATQLQPDGTSSALWSGTSP